MIKSLAYIFLINMIVFFNICNAQTTYFKNYSTKNGLPSSETYEVFQDSKNFIWIASDKGVARFDGTSFKIYTTNNGLPDNTIFGFYEDELGRIWFRSFSGKLSYFKDGKITSLKINDELQRNLKQDIFLSLAYKNDTLWLGAMIESNHFKIVWNKKGKEKLIVEPILKFGNYIQKIDSKKFIYGTNHFYNSKLKNENIVKDFRYLSFFDKNKRIKNSLCFPTSIDHNPNIKCIKLRNGNYLSSQLNSIVILDKSGNPILKYDLGNQNSIISLCEDSKNGIWIGTLKNGLFYYPNGNFKTNPIRYFENESISSVMEDKELGLWISTLGKGVIYMPYKDIKNYTQDNGEIVSKITCIKAFNNQLWVGFDNGILKVYGQLKNYQLNFNQKDIPKIIKQITPLNNNQVLINTSKGSFLINKNKPNEKVAFKDDYTYTSLFSKKDSSIWIVQAIYIIQLSKSNWKFKQKSLRIVDKIHSLAEDSRGTLWLGCMKGLWNEKNAKLYQYKNKLLNERINDLKISKNNIFWMATKNKGLVIKKGNKIYNITQSQGLSGNICQTVAIENDFTGWIGTSNGLSRVRIISFSPFKYEIKNFNTKNGLASNEVNFITLSKDNVYIASNESITYFNKKNISNTKYSSPVYITQLKIKDSLYPVTNKYGLNYDQNSFQISYVGLCYKNDNNTDYKYRLIGLDTTWSYTKYTSVNFTTLPYGNYTFEVLAKNNEGSWSSKPATINFTISPPFWHTWWFRILSGLLLITGIYTFIKYRIGIVEKRAQEKADLFKKAAEMEMKFLSSQMNPHFTFNAMNSIQYFMLENEPQKAQKYLAKYSKLIRKVLENNMDKYTFLLDEIQMLELYMEIESMRFSNKFEYEINLSEELNNNQYLITPMILQPYIENAIWHGLFNKKDGKGKINLHFVIDNNKIICTIEDNGVGREKARELKSNKKEHRSVGMLITQQRIDYLNTDSDLEVTTKITDLKSKEGEDIGTKVEVYLPLIKGEE